MAIEIEQHLVKNFWQGRGNLQPVAIVEHTMQGELANTFAIFNGAPTPTGQSYRISAHYGVAKDGRVWQFVRDEDTAWANGVLNQPDPSLDWLHTPQNGKFNPNTVTLSIEYEGVSGEALTEAQYQAALALHQQLLARWNIPADNEHIVGHDRLDSAERQADPGPAFPWSRLLSDLQTHLPQASQAQLEEEVEPATPALEAISPWLFTDTAGSEAFLEAEVAPLAELAAESESVSVFQAPSLPPDQEPELYEVDAILANQPYAQSTEETGELYQLDQILAQAQAQAEPTLEAVPATPSNAADNSLRSLQDDLLSFDFANAVQLGDELHAAKTDDFELHVEASAPTSESNVEVSEHEIAGTTHPEPVIATATTTESESDSSALDPAFALPDWLGTEDLEQLPNPSADFETFTAHLDNLEPAQASTAPLELEEQLHPVVAATIPEDNKHTQIFDDPRDLDLAGLQVFDTTKPPSTKVTPTTTPAADLDLDFAIDDLWEEAPVQHHPATPLAAAPTVAPSTPSGLDLDDLWKEEAPAQHQPTTPLAAAPTVAPSTPSGLDLDLDDLWKEEAPAQHQPAPTPMPELTSSSLASAVEASPANPTETHGEFTWGDLGSGVVKVELANVRKRPSFDADTVLRTVEEGQRLHFDAYTTGPELYGGTRWLHITRQDGDGWIHANLVQLS
jgi:N-acetyl-anhydromuramyl-L-alanine amidase AmpD